MTPAEFRAARKSLGYTQQGLADLWGMGKDGCRQIGRWERGEIRLNPVAAYCMALMVRIDGA